MKNKLLNLLLIGSIVLSVVLVGCKKAKSEENKDSDYSKARGEFTDTRDNKTYKWVKIGDQIWMAENLAYTGKGIRNITDKTDWRNNVEHDAWCYYYNKKDYKDTYGVLYQWEAAKKSCPKGWHLPDRNEWVKMEKYLRFHGYSYNGIIGYFDIAKSLASDHGWKKSKKTGAVGNSDYPEFRNKTGFSALPGGFRSYPGKFYGLKELELLWIGSDDGASRSAYYCSLKYDNSKIEYKKTIKVLGFAVRCVKD